MKQILMYGFKYIFRYKILYFIYFSSQILMSITSLFIPLVEGKIIDLLVDFDSLEFKKYILLLLMIMIASLCLSSLSSFLYFKLQALCGNESNMDEIRHLYSISYIHLLDKDPSVLNQSINNDCNNIIIFCLSSLQKIIVSIFSVLFIIIIISRYSIEFIGMIFLSLILYLCIYFYFKKRLYDANKNVLNSGSEFFGALYQLVFYLKSIKMCSLYNHVKKNEEKMFSKFFDDAKNQTILECKNDFLSNFLSLITQILMYVFGAYLILNQHMTIGTLVVVINYYSNILSNAQIILDFGNSVQKCKASYDRLNELKSINSSVIGNKVVNDMKKMSVKKLSFHYPDCKDLFCLNYDFEKGNIYQINGQNGLGKSTLLQVIAGVFGDDYKGDIRIDNTNIKEMDKYKFLLNHVSICTQEPLILENTVEYNLTLNNQHSTEKLRGLLMGFDLKVPLDMFLHPLNLGLSGGQKQKIGLIRTLLSNADILIFDEPISALDVESKKYFEKCIKTIKDKIIIIVSHEELKGVEVKSISL